MARFPGPATPRSSVTRHPDGLPSGHLSHAERGPPRRSSHGFEVVNGQWAIATRAMRTGIVGAGSSVSSRMARRGRFKCAHDRPCGRAVRCARVKRNDAFDLFGCVGDPLAQRAQPHDHPQLEWWPEGVLAMAQVPQRGRRRDPSRSFLVAMRAAPRRGRAARRSARLRSRAIEGREPAA